MSMKKQIWIGIGIALLIFLGYNAYLYFNPASPPESVAYERNGLTIEVDYSRPYKKDRLIFGAESDGALQPYGQYWRTGANAATEITFSQDVIFGGEPVSAGTYSLYTIPGEENWTIALNNEHGRSGASPPDEANDVVRLTVPSETYDDVKEQFLIDFEEQGPVTYLILRWDQVKVSVPVRAA